MLDRPRGADAGQRELRPPDEALAHLAAGDLRAAEAAAYSALRDGTDAAIAHLALGRIALARGDPGGARAALEHALELAPELDAARAELAAIAQRAGRLDEAIDHYRAALARQERSPKLLHALAPRSPSAATSTGRRGAGGALGSHRARAGARLSARSSTAALGGGRGDRAI
jgi:tetratricopeptide (TPR) repeat protein